MKTQEDVLSFHDLEAQRYTERNELCVSLVYAEEMSLRLIHTFLEWELYEKYIYRLGWSLTYTAYQSERDRPPIVTSTNVDTLQEAEIIAIKKISRFLGDQVHLESMKDSPDISHPSPYDTYYKVIDGDNQYCGMVAIEPVSQNDFEYKTEEE